MKLYFENSKQERIIIAEPETEEGAIEFIHVFCEERNFKIYYMRTWREMDGLKVYDVGSWSEFFLLDDK